MAWCEARNYGQVNTPTRPQRAFCKIVARLVIFNKGVLEPRTGWHFNRDMYTSLDIDNLISITMENSLCCVALIKGVIMSAVLKKFLEAGAVIKGNHWSTDTVPQIEMATGFAPEVVAVNLDREPVTVRAGAMLWQRQLVKILDGAKYYTWLCPIVMLPIDRFVVDHGEAVPFSPQRHGPMLDWIFIRDDGWVVACSLSDVTITRELWKETWKYEIPVTESLRLGYQVFL